MVTRAADARPLGHIRLEGIMADRQVIRYRIAVAVLSIICIGLLTTTALLLRNRSETVADMQAVSPDAIMASLNEKLASIGQKRADGLDVKD